MAQIYAGSANFTNISTTKTIHAKAGKLRGIIASAYANSEIQLYDNTAASGAILLVLHVPANQTVSIFPELLTPLTFAVGLTIKTDGNGRCFVITEA